MSRKKPRSDPMDRAIDNLEKSVRNLRWAVGFAALAVFLQIVVLVAKVAQ